ncbi:MAG: hypothetical protein KGS44_06870 [Alphaproteobacteria bacterium]|nr:hypothetical protein [Alphaproteobacteria bacterium]
MNQGASGRFSTLPVFVSSNEEPALVDPRVAASPLDVYEDVSGGGLGAALGAALGAPLGAALGAPLGAALGVLGRLGAAGVLHRLWGVCACFGGRGSASWTS